MSVARVIAIANRKGGVGKTTTTVSLGAALAERGQRVLLVDLDNQQSLSSSLRATIPNPGLADILFSQFVLGVGELREIVADVGGMAVAGGYSLSHADNHLRYYGASWEFALDQLLAASLEDYDFVLIDCGPSIGCLTTNALAAADEILVPVQTEFLAVTQLSGVMEAVDSVRGTLNPELEVAGFLPTLFDRRTRHSINALMKISTAADRYRVRVFPPIPRTVLVAEAAALGQPISKYSAQSTAALAYDALASEIETAAKTRRSKFPPATSLTPPPSFSRPPHSNATRSTVVPYGAQTACERIAADPIISKAGDGFVPNFGVFRRGEKVD